MENRLEHGDTRERLMLTAERLFAEEGLRVSMRRINQEAGQKNSGALHYHFGSRDALIDALLQKRMLVIDRRRAQLLSEAEQAGTADDPRTCVGCMVWPLAECLQGPDDMRYYPRFLAQLHYDKSFDLSSFVFRKYNNALHQVNKRLMGILSDIPPAILRARIDLVIGEFVYAIAEIAQTTKQARCQNLEFRVNNLIDCLAGALAAPVAPATAKLAPESAADGDKR